MNCTGAIGAIVFAFELAHSWGRRSNSGSKPTLKRQLWGRLSSSRYLLL